MGFLQFTGQRPDKRQTKKIVASCQHPTRASGVHIQHHPNSHSTFGLMAQRDVGARAAVTTTWHVAGSILEQAFYGSIYLYSTAVMHLIGSCQPTLGGAYLHVAATRAFRLLCRPEGLSKDIYLPYNQWDSGGKQPIARDHIFSASLPFGAPASSGGEWILWKFHHNEILKMMLKRTHQALDKSDSYVQCLGRCFCRGTWRLDILLCMGCQSSRQTGLS